MARGTLRDISRETGFAVSTISNVLNERKSCFASAETRQKIREAADRLGYQPDHFARSLRTRRSWTIAVVGRLFSSQVQAEQFKALNDALVREGFFVSFSYGDVKGNISETLNRVAASRVDGVVLWNDRDDKTEDREFVPPDVPIVSVGGRPRSNIPSVIIERAEAVRNAVHYLADLGHRDILLLIMKRGRNQGKVRGYEQGMAEIGAKDRIACLKMPEVLGSAMAFVRENAPTLRRATAVVTNGDQVAMELIAGLVEVGIKVPQDISVVGFNDDRIALATRPTLTTLRQPREELAEVVTRMLLNLIAGRKVRNRRLVPELVVRDSVAPARKVT